MKLSFCAAAFATWLVLASTAVAEPPTIVGAQNGCNTRCLWLLAHNVPADAVVEIRRGSRARFLKVATKLLTVVQNPRQPQSVFTQLSAAFGRSFKREAVHVRLTSLSAGTSNEVIFTPDGGLTGASRVSDLTGAQLTLFDGFSSISLDRSLWTRGYSWARYPPSSQSWWSSGSARNKEGKLNLTCRYAPQDFLDAQGNLIEHRDYGCGVIRTEKKFAQAYGYFEARMRSTYTTGTNNAFWLSPNLKWKTEPNTQWWLPEIDIVEILTKHPRRATLTNHYLIGPSEPKMNSKEVKGPDFAADFHNIAVEWNPSLITWYIDGVAVWSSNRGVPQEPLMILFSIETGSNFAGLAPLDKLPATMEVDWITVYDRKPYL